MEEKTLNTVKAVHISEDGILKTEEYTWHLPKALRGEVKIGDVVSARTKNGLQQVLITELFREDVEVTGKSYKSIAKKGYSVLDIDKIMSNIGKNIGRLIVAQKNNLVEYNGTLGETVGLELSRDILGKAQWLHTMIGGSKEIKLGE